MLEASLPVIGGLHGMLEASLPGIGGLHGKLEASPPVIGGLHGKLKTSLNLREVFILDYKPVPHLRIDTGDRA